MAKLNFEATGAELKTFAKEYPAAALVTGIEMTPEGVRVTLRTGQAVILRVDIPPDGG
jgi:hypothetical protein